jgi:hypothetical protein
LNQFTPATDAALARYHRIRDLAPGRERVIDQLIAHEEALQAYAATQMRGDRGRSLGTGLTLSSVLQVHTPEMASPRSLAPRSSRITIMIVALFLDMNSRIPASGRAAFVGVAR